MFIGMLYSYCMFIFIGIHANPSYTIHTESLTTSNGLSNNTVRHIYQDSKGFIWFSTLNGLNRYDGNTFRTFLPDSIGELPSLADGRVKSVCEDNHGFLWISTSIDRFSCYDLKRDCFVDYTGCEAFKEQYAYITLLSDAVWLWGRGRDVGAYATRMTGSILTCFVWKMGHWIRMQFHLSSKTVWGVYG